MKRDICNQAELSRFYDEELEPGEYARMMEHVESCRVCGRVLRENRAVSQYLRDELEGALDRFDLERVEESVLALIRRRTIPWWTRLGQAIVSKRFIVPATAAVALTILIFSLFGRPGSMAGPSAIVSSVEGDMASVMILETPESRQTVVWITEDFTSNGGDHGNG